LSNHFYFGVSDSDEGERKLEVICHLFSAKTMSLTGRLINKISDEYSKYFENSNVSKNVESRNAEHPTYILLEELKKQC
jgi:hypothetical protein